MEKNEIGTCKPSNDPTYIPFLYKKSRQNRHKIHEN